MSADADAARHPFILDADEFTSKVIELHDRIEALKTAEHLANEAANRAIEDATEARGQWRQAERELCELVGLRP